MSGERPPTVRFDEFVLDTSNCDLRRRGRTVRLERKPMDLLILLATRPGQLVLRSEIVDRLWGSGVFVDTDLAVNTAIGKVRRALHDSAEAPRFIETVPGRGYRFISEVDVAEPAGSSRAVTLAVLPFANLGAGPERDYVADGFTEEAIAALGRIDPGRLRVISRSSVERFRRSDRPLAEIGRELDATHVLESSMRAEGERYRITCRLVELPEAIQLWSMSYDSEPSVRCP